MFFSDEVLSVEATLFHAVASNIQCNLIAVDVREDKETLTKHCSRSWVFVDVLDHLSNDGCYVSLLFHHVVKHLQVEADYLVIYLEYWLLDG